MAKITKFDLAVVGVTLAFLLGIGLYCWKTSMTTQPYRVEVSQREEIAPAEEGSDPPSKLLEGETININTASAAELQRLPGIGEKRAEAIVAWRMEHGSFAAPEDLTQVSGIGEKILEQCRAYITVEG